MQPLSLSHFEQFIDPTILKRGLNYFNSGHVEDPEEVRSGFFTAIVRGSEEYEVEVAIRSDEIVHLNCTCPYDLGPVCKHEVAVILWLVMEGRQHDEETATPKKGKKQPVSSQSKSVESILKEVMNRTKPDELKQFISEYAITNRVFREQFLLHFSEDRQELNITYFKKSVQSILNSAGKRSGFIHWDKAGIVGKKVFDLLQGVKLKAALQVKFNAAVAVLEELTKALDYTDDSNADIGDNISLAFDLLYDCACDPSMTPSMRNEIWNYVILAWKNKTFDGWDWHFGMLEVAAVLARSEVEIAQLTELLNTINSKSWEHNEAQTLLLKLLEKSGQTEEAQKFIKINISNPNIREKQIETLIRAKRYAEAWKLAEDGIKHDQKKKPGLVQNWKARMLEIACATGDVKNIWSLTTEAIVTDEYTEKHLKIAKKFIPSNDWPDYISQLIHKLKNSNGWHESTLRQVFVFEERWDDLAAILEETNNVYTILDYEKYLSATHKPQLAKIYSNVIMNEMEHVRDRTKYKGLVRVMRKMKKLGQHDVFDTMISSIRKKYGNRPSLMEEMREF